MAKRKSKEPPNQLVVLDIDDQINRMLTPSELVLLPSAIERTLHAINRYTEIVHCVLAAEEFEEEKKPTKFKPKPKKRKKRVTCDA